MVGVIRKHNQHKQKWSSETIAVQLVRALARRNLEEEEEEEEEEEV